MRFISHHAGRDLEANAESESDALSADRDVVLDVRHFREDQAETVADIGEVAVLNRERQAAAEQHHRLIAATREVAAERNTRIDDTSVGGEGRIEVDVGEAEAGEEIRVEIAARRDVVFDAGVEV